jgi:NAD(P)-dependent dehydrogenase (short-subunit alcohol dehydrogenase family)
MSTSTNDFLEGRTVLVTGANRGLGQSLVQAALTRGARRVYAGARKPVPHPDERVVPLRLDITDGAQVELAAQAVAELDLLVNNAGDASFAALDDRSELDRMLAVNLFGPYDVSLAFRPQLLAAKGAVVNVLSVASVAAIPMTPAYSIAKGAAYSFTQVLRSVMGLKGVRVHAVLAGPIDTDMSRPFDIPKTAPEAVASAILDAVAAGDEDVFPDPLAELLAQGWADGAVKTMQHANAALLES